MKSVAAFNFSANSLTEAISSPVSTWMGDRLATLGAVDKIRVTKTDKLCGDWRVSITHRVVQAPFQIVIKVKQFKFQVQVQVVVYFSAESECPPIPTCFPSEICVRAAAAASAFFAPPPSPSPPVPQKRLSTSPPPAAAAASRCNGAALFATGIQGFQKVAFIFLY